MKYHHLIQKPLALWDGYSESLIRSIKFQEDSNKAFIDMDSEIQEWKPYDVVSGVAIIPIDGVLVHEECWYGWMFGERSYGSIARAVMAAMTDHEVKGLAYVVNSPGGVCSGCFDLADALFALRGQKPSIAIVDEMAYSAAYALASAADEIVLPRTGGVGSVGVICMHIDITKMLDEMGVKVTTIQFGDRKSDSYPTTPLSKQAEKNMQAEVDMLGEMFVDLVARNRGMAKSAVLNTQAGCFLGEASVEVGFADSVKPVNQAFVDFITKVNGNEKEASAAAAKKILEANKKRLAQINQ